MNTLLIFISDVHFKGIQPENEGIVLKAFLQDVKKQLLVIPHQEVYILIGGDLVQTADNKDSYKEFEKKVIEPLMILWIKKKHIICVPGNHDIERQWISKNKSIYISLINKKYTESEFNELAENNDSSVFLTNKFNNYSDFAKNTLNIENYNPIGFNVELNENWSLYCMNSSLTSYAGIDDDQYPQLKDDVKKLNIDTRRLYQWLDTNLKKKILMIHHPLDFLTEWSSIELRKIVEQNFDLVLTGHTHEQEILCNNNN